MVKEESRVLPNTFGGGPHGLGEPDDRTLRNVEKEVMIPKVMREQAKKDKCPMEVEAFEKCCKGNSLFMVFNCRTENDALKTCQTRWYRDEQFVSECTDIYLQQRAEYRRTGLTVKQRAKLSSTGNVGNPM